MKDYVITYYEMYPISNEIQSCIIEAPSVNAAVEHFYNTKHGIIIDVSIALFEKEMTEAC